MEDNTIGKHCDYPNCNLKDYLNFTCGKCLKNLCKEHYHHEVSCPFAIDNEKEEEKMNEERVFDYKVTKCSYCSCDILNIKPFDCKICKKLFCAIHRIESDHKCKEAERIPMKTKYEQIKEMVKMKTAAAKKKYNK